MNPEFESFTGEHWLILAFLAGTLLTLAVTRRPARPQPLSPWRAAAALFLLLLGITNWLYLASLGIKAIPLQLCDLTLILMAWALSRPSHQAVAELAVLWALAGSAQAILTPDLTFGFPHPMFFFFFLTHGGVIVGAFYLITRGFARLNGRSIFRGMLWTNGYAAAVGLVNWHRNTNFGYLAAKPEQPSLLDYLGPWPYYLLSLEAAACLLFALCVGLGRLLQPKPV